jgi:hypothetical protein
MLLEFRLNFLKIVNVTSRILQQCHSIISIQRGERSPSFRCNLDRIVPEQLLKYSSWWPKTRWPSSLLLFFKSLHRNLFYLWLKWSAENSFCLSTCPSLYIRLSAFLFVYCKQISRSKFKITLRRWDCTFLITFLFPFVPLSATGPTKYY